VPVVSSCHGMYWDGYDWGDWAYAANRRVIDALCKADAITAPSRWVAHAITRGMLATPTVIYHGVDTDIWTPRESRGYVLWNKARTDAVSDAGPMNAAAQRLRDTPFVSTFGLAADNVRILGAVPYPEMPGLVAAAGIYLSTARETFGIGTIEALSCGVPVVGYRYGGQPEIVIEDETGYLVEPGDEEGLAAAITRALANRARLSANARADAVERWQWRGRVAEYARVFDAVRTRARATVPEVSVVITCHNLAQFLPDAIRSVRGQSMEGVDLLVVDDASKDDSVAVAQSMGAPVLALRENVGLSEARNIGWRHTAGRNVLFLDADDMLAPNALQVLADALRNDRSLHIAAGRLAIMSEDTGALQRGSWPGTAYDWRGQTAHLNQIAYAALIRREVLERSGGYRRRDWRAEDAAMWLRVTSLGFRAEIVSNEPLLWWRNRTNSKSKVEAQTFADRDGDWTAWYPWRLGAESGRLGEELIANQKAHNPRLVPWGAQGHSPTVGGVWPVRHHEGPLISIIIPVGPAHAAYLPDALDSVQAQTLQRWECIVVNDGAQALDLTPWPWARLAQTEQPGSGAGVARNVGLALARAPLVTFLDADDALLPAGLALLAKLLAERGGYTYGDCLITTGVRLDQGLERHVAAPNLVALWQEGGVLAERGRHAVTALVPTVCARAVGGFDETMSAWEDWDFYLKLTAHGLPAYAVDAPVLIYRLSTGQRRNTGAGVAAGLLQTIRARYAHLKPEEVGMGCNCGGGVPAKFAAAALADIAAPGVMGAEEAIRTGSGVLIMEFIGATAGAQTYGGRGITPSGRAYRGGNNAFDRYQEVAATDAPWLVRLGLWRIVEVRK